MQSFVLEAVSLSPCLDSDSENPGRNSPRCWADVWARRTEKLNRTDVTDAFLQYQAYKLQLYPSIICSVKILHANAIPCFYSDTGFKTVTTLFHRSLACGFAVPHSTVPFRQISACHISLFPLPDSIFGRRVNGVDERWCLVQDEQSQTQSLPLSQQLWST